MRGRPSFSSDLGNETPFLEEKESVHKAGKSVEIDGRTCALPAEPQEASQACQEEITDEVKKVVASQQQLFPVRDWLRFRNGKNNLRWS